MIGKWINKKNCHTVVHFAFFATSIVSLGLAIGIGTEFVLMLGLRLHLGLQQLPPFYRFRSS